MKKYFSKTSFQLLALAAVLLLVIGIHALAFTEPVGSPPTGGPTTVPINTSASSQIKGTGTGQGTITADGLFSLYSTYLATASGNVGVGNTNPQQKLDVSGYINAASGLCIGESCISSWPSTITAGATAVTSKPVYDCSGNPYNGSGITEPQSISFQSTAPEIQCTNTTIGCNGYGQGCYNVTSCSAIGTYVCTQIGYLAVPSNYTPPPASHQVAVASNECGPGGSPGNTGGGRYCNADTTTATHLCSAAGYTSLITYNIYPSPSASGAYASQVSDSQTCAYVGSGGNNGAWACCSGTNTSSSCQNQGYPWINAGEGISSITCQ